MVSANPIYFNYRIKLEDSIETKIWSYVRRGQSFAVRKSLNDIVGGRIIMSGLRAHEDDWLQRFKQSQEQEIVRPYIRDDAGYHALHLYIQGGNKYLPWEIQIWDQEDRRNNFVAHDAHEQRKEGK
jgi:ppGpp synthetase/RelA/SpoT-type nucleotidyltranferase